MLLPGSIAAGERLNIRRTTAMLCPSLAECRVLVVEDDYFIAADIVRDLMSRGAQVVGPIGRLDEALEKVSEGDFDVATIDLGLADGRTYDVARALRRQNIPFIFVTGYPVDTIPAEYADVPCLEKPCDYPKIVRAIRALCPSGKSTA